MSKEDSKARLAALLNAKVGSTGIKSPLLPPPIPTIPDDLADPDDA